MKNEEETRKETWQKPEICELDIHKTAGKFYEPTEDDTDVFGPS